MDGVEDNFLAQDLNLQVEVVECLGHSLELANGVVDKPTPLAPVVELKGGNTPSNLASVPWQMARV